MRIKYPVVLRRIGAGRRLNALRSFISGNRYAILSLLIILLMLSHLSNKRWEGDFWVHVACVRELAANPLSPHNPILLANEPCDFYTPYTLFIALCSRATKTDAITCLAVAGVINLLLLLISLRLFVSSYITKDVEKTAFYTLLFMLFLWGAPPWFWSGFFHMDALGYVLPYPSTFTAALIFFSFALYIHVLKGAHLAWLSLYFLICPMLLLTHPTTAIVFYAGLGAFTIGFKKWHDVTILSVLAGAFAFSILVALIYPYFSCIDLFLAKAGSFHEDNYDLYMNIVPRTLPLLIGAIPLVGRMRRDRFDPLVLFFLFLVCIYVYGALSGSYTYGRVVFYLVLLLQIALAASVAGAETRRDWRGLLLLVAYLYLAAPLLPTRALSSMAQYRPGRDSNYSNLLFLSRYTRQYDVILSDIRTSFYVPAFGGKVVAYDNPSLHGLGKLERGRAVSYFLGDEASDNDRVDIIRKYHVTHLLINMERREAGRTLAAVAPFGELAYRSLAYSLIRVDEGRPVFVNRDRVSLFRRFANALSACYKALVRRPCARIARAVSG